MSETPFPQLPESMSGDELSDALEQLCTSKAEEFRMLGYDQVSGRDVWNCVSEKYGDAIPALHRVVNDILSLRVTQLMNWMTLSAYKGTPF